MTQEELEDFQMTISSPGFKFVIKELDAIVMNIMNGVHGCSLSNDPSTDGQRLLMARMKYEGALATKQALVERLKGYKEKR